MPRLSKRIRVVRTFAHLSASHGLVYCIARALDLYEGGSGKEEMDCQEVFILLSACYKAAASSRYLFRSPSYRIQNINE